MRCLQMSACVCLCVGVRMCCFCMCVSLLRRCIFTCIKHIYVDCFYSVLFLSVSNNYKYVLLLL